MKILSGRKLVNFYRCLCGRFWSFIMRNIMIQRAIKTRAVPIYREINELSWSGCDYYRLTTMRLLQRAKQLLTLSYYYTPLPWMDAITDPYKNKKHYPACYAQANGKCFKEITSQAYGKYSFCQVSQKLDQKFLTFFTYRIHDFSITYRSVLSSFVDGVLSLLLTMLKVNLRCHSRAGGNPNKCSRPIHRAKLKGAYHET